MPPTKPLGIDPATGRVTEFIISTGGSAIWDGGGASQSYVGGPVIDCGHAS